MGAAASTENNREGDSLIFFGYYEALNKEKMSGGPLPFNDYGVICGKMTTKIVLQQKR